jgi:hypothetical protein
MKSSRPSAEALQWIGLFAAPLAWTVQLVFGYGFAVGACDTISSRTSVSLTTWEIAITVAAATVALGGQLAALLAWRATQGRSDVDAPSAGRIRFFAGAALLANTIFLIMILLGGITAVHLAPCRQA